jgi:hypothetical protein
LPCYGTHDVEAHPLIRFEQQVAHASFPEHRQWGRRRDRELNLKQTMALCSAPREAATAGQSGGQATASPGPMAHRASRMIWRSAGLWPRREHHIASLLWFAARSSMIPVCLWVSNMTSPIGMRCCRCHCR